MRPPLDPDPLTPEDWLWDPLERRFVPRRPTLIPMMLSALAGAIVTLLVVAAVTHAGPPSAPGPEPSFVPVPTMIGEVWSVPIAPPVKATPAPKPTARPTPKPAPVVRGHVIRGSASWCAPTPTYCHGWGGTARLAAVPTFHYGDRPYLIRVCAGSRCVTATVVSFCACRAGRVVDLTPYLFRQLAPLSRGVVQVTMRRL